MSSRYDVISTGSEQFLVEMEEELYRGEYDIPKLYEDIEEFVAEQLTRSTIKMVDAEYFTTALTAELVALKLTDQLHVIEITHLGE